MKASLARKIGVGVLGITVLVTVCFVALFQFAPWYLVLALWFLAPAPHEPFDVWTSTDCTPMRLGSVTSPDGRMEAQAFHVLCTAPLVGFFTNTADHHSIVIVARNGKPSVDATAMNVNLGWSESETMQWESDIVWRSATQLEVTLPDSASVWEKKPTVAGVSVDVKRVASRVTARQPP